MVKTTLTTTGLRPSEKLHDLMKITINTLSADLEDYTTPIPKPVIGHHPEAVLSVSDPKDAS
jgi:hypothetical protein